MLSVYPACFYEENGGGFSVIFPDLNHLSSCGNTLTEAIENAVDCLAGYLFSAISDGDVIPEPSDIKEINPDSEYDEYKNAFVNLVSVDVEEYAKIHFDNTVSKTVLIPEWLNTAAENANVNFSAVLQEGLVQKLGLKGV